MDPSKNITLNWSELIGITQIKDQTTNQAGIYIWGFSLETAFIPYYVGIADNILFRIYQHLNSIIGGQYTIFHKDSIANFAEFKSQEVNQKKTNGKIYCPNWPYGYQEFLEERKALQPHIDFMIDSFSYTFAVIEKDSNEINLLKELEKICINQIGLEKLINTRSGNPEKLNLKHKGNPLISQILKTNI